MGFICVLQDYLHRVVQNHS